MSTTPPCRTALNHSLTVKRVSVSTGQLTVVEAFSACGRWRYSREESTGTPWAVIDLYNPNPESAVVCRCANLRQARRTTANDEWIAWKIYDNATRRADADARVAAHIAAKAAA